MDQLCTLHNAIPQADCVSNAGCGVPGERETRFRTYTEKQRLSHKEDAQNVKE
ncbi:MAG: hypothetical protein PHO41_09095 [Eubacteriales bacterium]|nr:hypothetical protein [Eubacteriales bacterium]